MKNSTKQQINDLVHMTIIPAFMEDFEFENDAQEVEAFQHLIDELKEFMQDTYYVFESSTENI